MRDQEQGTKTTCQNNLSGAASFDERRQRLQRYATWSEHDSEEFDSALRDLRKVDERSTDPPP